MKRLLVIFLALIMILMLGLGSCGKQTGVKKEEQSANHVTETIQKEEQSANHVTETIQLTTYNIKNYLNFEFSYGELSKSIILGSAFWSTDLKTTIYPTVAGSFSNVQMKLEIECPVGWMVNTTDAAYKEQDVYTMFIDVVLPSSGNYSRTTGIGTINYGSTPSVNTDLWVKVVSASGTFKAG